MICFTFATGGAAVAPGQSPRDGKPPDNCKPRDDDKSRGGKPDDDTLALYHCDEGQGDVLTDSSGNGHHARLNGATWTPIAGSATPQRSSLRCRGCRDRR